MTKDACTQAESPTVEVSVSNNSFTQEFCTNMKKVLIELFKSLKDSNIQEKSISAAVDNFNIERCKAKENMDGVSRKRYFTRQQIRDKGGQSMIVEAAQAGEDLDNDLLEEGVLSSSDGTSDFESIYQTVEKRQVKLTSYICTAVKLLSAEEFLKAGQKVAEQKLKDKKKKSKIRK